MDEQERKQARAILDACERARARLYGTGTPKQRLGQAQLALGAYEDAGVLGASVRDFRNARKINVADRVLTRLEGLARAFAEAP